MMPIKKCKEQPKELRGFHKVCKEKGVDKKDYCRFKDNNRDGFEELQKSLLVEQNYLCCYCMKKIDMKINNVKHCITIEHFEPKSRKPELSLTYSNLLACCDGKDGKIKFCGTSKADLNLDMIPNPSNNKYNLFFTNELYYRPSGEITFNTAQNEQYSESKKLKLLIDINEILNLNNEILVKARTEKLQEIIKLFKNKHQKSHKVKKLEFFQSLGFFSYYAFVKSQFIK